MGRIYQIKDDINKLASPKRAEIWSRFFKTEPGGYGEGDKFIGVLVPELRKFSKKYKDLSIDEIVDLLSSPIHEHRFLALAVMVLQARRAKDSDLSKLYNTYLANIRFINNWDLVDSSCHYVVGRYLKDKSRNPLYDLARSSDLWERRVSIVSTWLFIRDGDLDDTFKISEILLRDRHDLVHKAVGWMLREAGKRDLGRLCEFLDNYTEDMPRTCLRYAIERMNKEERSYYMKIKKS